MRTLEQRIKELERTRAERAGPCFWCECERKVDAPPTPCTHGNWNPIPHEAALAELN
jgi:hypothetical protein